ncbi:MAG: hypothetical protein EA378_07400 [Phycisphaerales bacterium]|nr:MAG: hypothetical protein EA378_07400 [Phycisphaerales bacterium]
MAPPRAFRGRTMNPATRRHAQARAIFLEAIDHPPEDRASVVRRAEASDPEAAAMARELLAHHDDEPRGPTSPAEAVTHVGPYRLLERLGSGGMGEVYRAEQTDPVERRVALKLMPPGFASAEATARFEAEALALAAVDHPGVARYLDSGVDAHGRHYLVTELVEGEPVAWDAPEIRTSPEAAVECIAAACAPVHRAHQRGLIHRDLKPANILLRQTPTGPEPVVIDFGIARALTGSAFDGKLLTMNLAPVGTPSYMAPEQTRPGEPPDVRSDVYALGAVLYELLTARPPLDPADADHDPARLYRMIREQTPRKPSEAVDPDRFGRAHAARRAARLRGDLDAIVLRSLDKNPARRFPSAESFAAELGRWLRHEPVESRPIATPTRLFRLARRHPGETATILVAAAAVTITTVAAVIGFFEARHATARAEEQLAITNAINAFMQEEVFARAAPELDGPTTPIIEIVRAAAERTDAALATTPAVETAMRSTLAEVLISLGDLEVAGALLAHAETAAAELLGAHPERYRPAAARASSLVLTERADAGAAALLELIPKLEHTRGLHDPITVRAWNDLGVALMSTGKLAEAQAAFETAAERSHDRPLQRFRALSNLATLYEDAGEPRRSIDAMAELLEIVEQRFGRAHMFIIPLSSNLAYTHLELGEPAEALPYARRAAEAAETILGPHHIHTLTTLNNLASALSQLDRAEDAIPIRERVLEGRTALLGEDAPGTLTATNNLASTLIRAARFERARPLAQRAAAGLAQHLGPAHPDTIDAFITLATVTACTEGLPAGQAVLEHAITQLADLGLTAEAARKAYRENADTLDATIERIQRRAAGPITPNPARAP